MRLVLRSGATHFFQQFFLSGTQMLWQINLISQNQVTPLSVLVKVAFSFQTNLGAGLGTRFHFQLEFFRAGGYDDLTSQDGRIHVNVHQALLVLYHRFFLMEPAEPAESSEVLEPAALGALPAMCSAEQLFKEIGEVASAAELAEVETFKTAIATGSSSGILEFAHTLPVLTVLIVFGSFLRIAQHIVCLVQRLKLGLGLRVIRMQVRMKLFGSFPISTFYVFLWCILRDTHDFIIIYKCHNDPSFFDKIFNK